MSYSPSSSRVRSLWQSFVKSSTGSRNATEHKIRAATAKADEAAKAGIARDIQEKSFRTLRAQWQSLLLKESLTDADWSDITEAEKDAVTTILGELPDDDQDPFPSSSSASPQMPPPNPIPYPHPLAPSFSNSTRSTNISSASSYAIVSPNELYSEDDGDLFMASSNDTSDEDEVRIQPVHFYPGRHGQNGWSSSESLGASLHNSIESSSEIPLSRPLASGFAQNTYYGRMSSAKQSAVAASASASASAASLLQSDKEKPSPPQLPGPKSKTARQPYIGPHLEDPNEPISEAEDFERFKMQTRMEKIVEFHQAAALAEIRLSFAIYKSRKSQAQDGEHRPEVSPLVLDHQRCMAQLQTAKEEERKTIVKRERSKRRSDLRGRPGRSNTLIAPTQGVPLDTNPPWLNGLEGQVSTQLAPQFDIDTLLSQDPNEQESNVHQMFGQFFPESPAADVASSMSSSQYSSANGHASSSRPAVRSGQGFSSASMQSGVPGPSSHARKRRPSDVRAKKAAKGKGRPSLFGEDDSSDEPAEDDEEDDDDDEDEEEHPLTARRNPFMDAHASQMLGNQFQSDFELQMDMARLGLLGDVQHTIPLPTPPPPAPPSMWNPGSRLMEQSPLPVAHTPSPWMAAKDLRSTATPAPVVPSGWTRKNTIVPAPTPQPTQVGPSNSTSSSSSTSSFRNPFGMGMGMGMTAQTAPTPPPIPPSTIPTPAGMTGTAKAKGRQFVPAPTPEPQPIWGQPHRKVMSPPIPAIPTEVPVVPTPTIAPPPQVAKPATPAPPPPAPAPASAAAASKKTTKKQRQAAAKKGGPAGPGAASASVVEESTSTSTPANPDSVIEDPYSVTEPTADPSSLFSSSISRMVPGMTRARMDSSAGMNGFGFASWDASGGGGDSVATPRPASKIPSHLQHLQQQQQQETLLDTPRANAKKNANANANHNPMVELFGQPLNKTAMEQLAAAGGSSTIRARGSSVANGNAPTPAAKSLWNLFSSESASAPVVAAKPPVGGDPWIPGGFDGGTDGGGGDDGGWGDDGGGGEVEETSQPFWQPQNRKATATPNATQKSSAATQNPRRMPEAPSPAPPPVLAPTPPAPTAKPATPASKPQAAAAAASPASGAANKKGKGKKGKGKKVMIEEVPDDDDKNDNIEPLPVDSKVIFVEASGEPDDSPVHHHQQLLESAMGGSSFGDEERSEDKESAFGGASSTAGGSQSDSVFGGGGGSEQGWGGGGAGFGFGWGGGAANAKPTAGWNHSAATDNESQGGPIWGRTSTPTSQSKQQTPVWGQMGGGKDNAKGKGKMADADQQQGSKIVNPNLKRKPAAGGKWL